MVRVYSGQNTVNGRTYPVYTVGYYLGTERIRKRFSDLAKAKAEADRVVTLLARGEIEATKITGADRAVFVEASRLLRPFSLSVLSAVQDHVDALKVLPPGVSVKEAASFYVHRHTGQIILRTVRQVVDEFIAQKTTAGRSAVYLRDMASRLNLFADSFRMPASIVSGA